jgi:hypothetical protein
MRWVCALLALVAVTLAVVGGGCEGQSQAAGQVPLRDAVSVARSKTIQMHARDGYRRGDYVLRAECWRTSARVFDCTTYAHVVGNGGYKIICDFVLRANRVAKPRRWAILVMGCIS